MEGPKDNFLRTTLEIIPQMKKNVDSLKVHIDNQMDISQLETFFKRVHGDGSAAGFDELVKPLRFWGTG